MSIFGGAERLGSEPAAAGRNAVAADPAAARAAQGSQTAAGRDGGAEAEPGGRLLAHAVPALDGANAAVGEKVGRRPQAAAGPRTTFGSSFQQRRRSFSSGRSLHGDHLCRLPRQFGNKKINLMQKNATVIQIRFPEKFRDLLRLFSQSTESLVVVIDLNSATFLLPKSRY